MGKALAAFFGRLSEKNGGSEKPEAVPVTKAEDNDKVRGNDTKEINEFQK